MASVDEILNSMLEEMKKYQKEYNDTKNEINTVLRDYTDKINELQQQRLALQDEGNKKIEALEAKCEQLSGKHSSLYEQYKKFAGKEPDFSSEEIVEEEPVAEKETKKSVKKSTKKTEMSVAKDEVLSPEEIEKLSKIANNKTENVVKDSNGNEVPEYLKDAYTK